MFRLKVLSLLALIIFAACDVKQITEVVVVNPPQPPDTMTHTRPTTTDTMKAISMRINPQEARMRVGDTLTFSPTCRNVNGNPVPCSSTSWRSNNNLIAEMLGGGKVMAKSVGTTTVCGAISSVIDNCAVVIVESAAPAYRIYGVFPSPVNVTLANGACGQQTQQLTATLTGDGTFPTAVRWSSLNTTIATVDSLGLVTARGAGTGTIKVVAVGDTTKSNVVYVTVNACTVQTDTTIAVTINPPTGGGPVGGEGLVTCMVRGPTSFTDRRCWYFTRNPNVVLVVQKDTTFATGTPYWGAGFRNGGVMRYLVSGSTEVCVYLPGALIVAPVCGKQTVK